MSAGEPVGENSAAAGEFTIEQAMNLAGMMIQRHELKDATTVYRRILEAAPGHPDALNFLAIVTCHLGEPLEALGYVRQAALAAPGHPGIHNNLGNILIETGDIDGAAAAFRRSVELDGTQPAPLNNLGSILKARRDYDGAEALLREALRLDGKYAPAHQNLGDLLVTTGRPKEAIDHFWQAAAGMHSRDFNPYYVAMAYERMGEREQAIAVMTEWLEKDPDNIVLKHLLPGFSGQHVPERASDAFVERVFDGIASSFEVRLRELDYHAPQLVAAALEAVAGPPRRALSILDAGCGTGLCAPLLRDHAERLVGVDLSGGMLEKAAQTKLYDELVRGELTAFLAGKHASYDAIVSADTLCYFGVLDALVAAACGALRDGGLLIFTVEALPDDSPEDFAMAVSGRYQHSGAYVERLLLAAGFDILSRATETLRMEKRQAVTGFVVVARRT